MNKKFYLFLLLIICSKATIANHIIGYDATYVYNGNNSYTVNFSLYRDCLLGNTAAIASDDPISFVVFDKSTSNKIVATSLNSISNSNVFSTAIYPCYSSLPNYCVNKINFSTTFTLPAFGNFYYTIQRCCMGNFENIHDDNNGSGNGITISSNITLGQSSSVFNTAIPSLVCANKTIAIDNSATNTDADSVTYTLCNIFDFGGSSSSPTTAEITPSPYAYLQHNIGYSFSNPLGNPTIFNLDTTTGLLTINTPIQGYFLVGICCNAWKNGLRTNTTKRAYTLLVKNCSAGSNIGFVCDSVTSQLYNNKYCMVQCDGSKTLTFNSFNKPNYTFLWNFGDSQTNADTANVANPTYTYIQNGIYTVQLITKFDSCIDTAINIISVQTEIINCDFASSSSLSPSATILLNDSSTSSGSPITNWLWQTNDTVFANTNYAYCFPCLAGNNKVVHYAGSQNGCWAKIEKTIHINTVNSFPNAFSPNGDNANDYFYLRNNNALEKMLIYNRSGNCVFEGYGNYAVWDGKYKGKPVSTNTYYWIAWFKDASGKTIVEKGDVILLR